MDTQRAAIARGRSLFALSLALGLLLIGAIYGVLFDKLSEERLILLSFVWLLPLTFGLYGLLGQAMIKRREEPLAPKSGGVFAMCLRAVTRHLPPILSLGMVLVFGLFCLPLLLVKSGSALRIATVGTALWIPVLAAFLVVVFPKL